MEKVTKHSKKRDSILEVIRSTAEHPSAEWIYSKVKQIHPDISLGTVYRNLAHFEQTGEVVAAATVNGQKRYDAFTLPHTHFICEDCGDVVDIETNGSFNDMYKDIDSAYGFSPNHHSLTFFGKCNKCK